MTPICGSHFGNMGENSANYIVVLPDGRKPGGHLDAFSCMDVFQNLYAQGTIDEKTEIVLTHINHYTSTHQQLCEWFAQQKVPYKMTVAYDGYEIK